MTADGTESGIELLSTHYSDRLRALYDRVAASYARPIRIEPVTGHVDNSIETRPLEVLLRLRPGSTEGLSSGRSHIR
jgi:hypothetical protein